jgi:hypothetical protein
MIRLLLCLAIAAPAAADPPPKLMAMFVHDGGARAAAVRTALRDSGLSWIGCRTVAGQTDRAVTFVFFRDHAQIASLALESGGEVPAFLFLTPMRSLADLDIDLSAAHENLFTEEQDRHRAAVLERAVRSNESMLLVVEAPAAPGH